MRRPVANPAQLVGLSFLGVLIIGGVFLVMAGTHRGIPHGWSALIARLTAPMMICCGSFYLIISTQNRLKDGIRLNRWTDAELRPIREFFEGRTAKTVVGVLMCIGLVLVVISIIKIFQSSYGLPVGYFVIWFLLETRFTAFSHILKVKASDNSQPQRRLQPSAPLQSEHWGE